MEKDEALALASESVGEVDRYRTRLVESQVKARLCVDAGEGGERDLASISWCFSIWHVSQHVIDLFTVRVTEFADSCEMIVRVRAHG